MDRILFVDDEPNLLASYERQLGRRFSVAVASSGARALEMLGAGEEFGVIVSDMRMPGMNGIELLRELERRSPETIRIMLTGNIDQKTAKEAVNEGKVFRFLTKPVAMTDLATAVDEGLAQFRTRRAEKELLEKTLGGVVKVLVEIMAAADPVAFSRASTIKEHASAIAVALGITSRWQIDLAAMLSQVGWVSVPADLRDKVREEAPLSEAEADLVRQVPAIGRGFLQHIPRLATIAELVYLQARGFDGSGFPDDGPSGEALPIGARILRVASDLAGWEAKGLNAAAALARLAATPGRYDPAVLGAARCRASPDPAETETIALDVTLRQAVPGDVTLTGIENDAGKLVLAAGQRLTEVTLARLIALDRLHALRQPFTVRRLVAGGTRLPPGRA